MEAHLSRGQAWVGWPQHEEALVDCEAVLELDPEADQAYRGRAAALVGQGFTRMY